MVLPVVGFPELLLDFYPTITAMVQCIWLKRQPRLEKQQWIEMTNKWVEMNFDSFTKAQPNGKSPKMLPPCMQSMRSRMFSMVVERSVFPIRIPSMASVMPANYANAPCWWKRANSKSNRYSRWEQTTATGRIRSKSSGVVNRSHHHLPRNPLNCVQKMNMKRIID